MQNIDCQLNKLVAKSYHFSSLGLRWRGLVLWGVFIRLTLLIVRLEDWISGNISDNFLYLFKYDLTLVHIVQEMHNVFSDQKKLLNSLHHDLQSKYSYWMWRIVLAFSLSESMVTFQLIHFYLRVFLSNYLCYDILNCLPSFFH